MRDSVKLLEKSRKSPFFPFSNTKSSSTRCFKYDHTYFKYFNIVPRTRKTRIGYSTIRNGWPRLRGETKRILYLCVTDEFSNFELRSRVFFEEKYVEK